MGKVSLYDSIAIQPFTEFALPANYTRNTRTRRQRSTPSAQSKSIAQVPAIKRGSGGVRQTRPENYSPYLGAGLGIIPRRGVQDPQAVINRERLHGLYVNNSLRLLSMLPDIHPSVGMAAWNALRLTCQKQEEGGLRIVAVSPTDVGKDATQIDENGTQAIEELWKSLPPEVGGLTGMQATLTLHALFAGLSCVEAVPGNRLEGLRRVWPVDPLTICFGRTDADSDVTAYQKQSGAGAPPSGYQDLNPLTFFWRSVDSFAGDPYGRAPYAPAAAEVLLDIALMKDLHDCLHNAAWPRYAVNLDLNGLYLVAQEGFNMDSTEASAYVMEQLEEIRLKVADMSTDDNPVIPSSVQVTILEGGKGLGNLESILAFLRQRIVQSLKTLPTLLGISDHMSETFSTVEWRIYASGLETLRSMVSDLLVKVANLHLRLLGLPFVAKAIYTPIQTSDGLNDQNIEAMKIKNAADKRDQGWIDQNQASQHVTGSDAVGEPKENATPPTGPTPQEQKKGKDATKQGG